MRVLVCGGRDFSGERFLFHIMDSVLHKHSDIEVIHGACETGADYIVEKWCRSRGVDYKGFPAKWKKYGKAAGPIRNKRMLEEEKPDGVIAFRGGSGTKHMCKISEDSGVKVWRTWQ